MNRKIRRTAGREHSKIQIEFWTMVKSFNQYMDWEPHPAMADQMLVKRFNAVWMQFCDHWDKRPHVMKPDRFAFINYVTGITNGPVHQNTE